MLPYSFTNWMGDEIHPGDTVFYCTGGSYPEYRLGNVVDFKQNKHGEVTAKVEWVWSHSYLGDGTPQRLNPSTRATSVNAQRICLVAPDTLQRVMEHKFALDNPKTAVV